MKNMTLQQIAHALNGQLFFPENEKEENAKEVSGVVIDNRNVERDFLFVPIVGQRVDGHQFIENAFERGAMGVLSQQPLSNPPGPYILVEDTQRALRELGAYYRRQLEAVVVGVIGSVGKTSTKEMLAAVLEQRFAVQKTQGNKNNEIGVPLTLFSVCEEHQVAVVEMGISDFGEMDRLGQCAAPDIVVMTNIGECHLEQLGDLDGVLKAKSEVFAHMPKDGVVVLNGDDGKLCRADTLGRKTIFYGLGGQEFSAYDIDSDSLEKVTAVLKFAEGERKVTIPLPGLHNVRNALAAAAVGVCLGMSGEEIVRGISSVSAVSGRNHMIETDGITVNDDCYNANPVSMKASLEVLSHAPGRKIAVLGDMGELGRDAKALHYQVGEQVVGFGIDYLFTAGELAKEMARAVADSNGSCRTFTFENRDDLIAELRRLLQPGDMVLVKASHFMEFERVVQAITNP